MSNVRLKVAKTLIFLLILGTIITLLATFVFVPIKVTNAYSSFYMEKCNSYRKEYNSEKHEDSSGNVIKLKNYRVSPYLMAGCAGLFRCEI